jgi:hypothetical protein
MSTYESSLSQVALSRSNDNTSEEHQRPAFDEKHVEKVLFVECGMFITNYTRHLWSNNEQRSTFSQFL